MSKVKAKVKNYVPVQCELTVDLHSQIRIISLQSKVTLKDLIPIAIEQYVQRWNKTHNK